MHCQEFPEQTDRTFLKQRSSSKGVPWVLELKMMPMMLFWSFFTRKSKALPLHSSARLGLSASALDAASLEHLTRDLESLAQKVSHDCY